MRPKDLLVASYDSVKKTAVITPIPPEGWITVCGASCRMNVETGEGIHALVVVPEEGSKDVIALVVSYLPPIGKYGHREDQCFFIEVTGGVDKPVDLEDVWIPPADRLATVTDSSVMVEIEGVRYIGHRYPNCGGASSGYYVGPNLLCKYLAGKVTAEEVKAAAKEFKKDELFLSQKEQKKLLAEAEWLRNENISMSERARMAEQLARGLNHELHEMRKKLGEFPVEMAELRRISIGFHDAAKRQWFKSKALRRAIADHKAYHRI
ncbi:MAG: hypothetical protein Q7R85_02440 [bacterium]|nr:hypothetical protein [bacterium]